MMSGSPLKRRSMKTVNELQSSAIPLLASPQGGEYARFQFVHTCNENIAVSPLDALGRAFSSFTLSRGSWVSSMTADTASCETAGGHRRHRPPLQSPCSTLC